jgi:hypothetical protein
VNRSRVVAVHSPLGAGCRTMFGLSFGPFPKKSPCAAGITSSPPVTS